MQLIGYVRVSRVGGREGDSFISPDVQRERIEQYAQAHGHVVVAYETDLDVSGGTMRRPAFERAMRAIEAGKSEGIIVAKLDRFSRTLDGALSAVRQLDAAGAVLVSCADQLDASTPTGKAMFRMLLVIAELQRDMITAEWQASRAKAIERGVHIATHVPRGYRRGESGRLIIDPVTAPQVVAAFEAKAAGRSLPEVAELLGMTRQGAAAVIRNRVYIGESHNGELTNPDAHEPIVSRELFEAANAARGVTRARGRGHVLSGIVRCASCRHALSGNGRQYKCSNDRCKARAAIKAETVEQLVRDAYAERITGPAYAAAIFGESAALLAALEAAEAELRAFVTIMRASEPGYREGYEARAAVVAEAKRAVAGIARPEVVAVDPAAPIAEQRAAFARSIVAVFVRRGKGEDRCSFVWQGETVELPSRGKRGEVLPAFAA